MSRTDVLVLRALGLGDTLAAVPALRALRRARLGRVTLAGPAGPGAMLQRHGLVDEVVPASGLELSGLPVPTVALNLHGSGPQSHRLLQRTLASGRPGPSGELVAFACAPAGVDGPTWDAGEHERARWCRLVGDRWSVPTDPDDVVLLDDPPPREDLVVVHPGAASGARRWPVERWGQVARALEGAGRVVVTGGPDERVLAERVALAAGLDERRVLAGRTTPDELVDVVARAQLVLSGDTGVAHLAYATATPSVTLFGPTPPDRWGPPAHPRHVVLWCGTGPGDPHADEVDPALLEISPAQVLAALPGR